MRSIPFIALCLALSGCATLEQFDNRISCTAAKDMAFVNSLYGPIGITSKVSRADTAVICK